MRSALYSGIVSHTRFSPKKHHFSYKQYMMYFDLDEVDELVSLSRLTSATRWAPLQFKRGDFHGNPENSIRDEIISTVRDKSGLEIKGPICALGNWRCFGLNFNPIVVYYCFDSSGENLKAVVAEVTNTPWFERHAYVMPVKDGDHGECKQRFEKQFTVSPFNPLNMDYEWKSSFPCENLRVNIENYQHGERVFHAVLNLKKIELNSDSARKKLRNMVLRFPFMTLKVVLAIYWEALKLYLKGVPFLGKDKVALPKTDLKEAKR